MANPPGVSVSVNAPTSSPQPNAPTGTWFVVGNAHGPAGIPVPVNSITDLQTYFGVLDSNGNLVGRYNSQGGSYSGSATNGCLTIDSSTLYDSLDVYFREGGVNAYVVRAIDGVASNAASAAATQGTFATFTAVSTGSWANSASGKKGGVVVNISRISSTTFTLSIVYNGQTMLTSGILNTATDAKNYLAAQPAYSSLVTVTVGATPSTIPGTDGTTTSVYLTGGRDTQDATPVLLPTDADYATALAALTDSYGPGQVSAPGVTSDTTHKNLLNHAQSLGRVALMDAVDSTDANYANLTAAVTAIQPGGSQAATDASYGAIFAPWVIVPGIASPSSTTAQVFNRTVPPSCVVAANIAASDQKNDCNVPAAGIVNGSSSYAIGLTQSYSSANRATLNNKGVNLIRNINGTIAVYGFRSTSADPNWAYFNNVRFRMQIVRDFDVLAENFVFQEIDGRGQIFSLLGGALAGQCQNYWLRKSIYGANPEDAFSVNVGPQVNTPATIAAGQINAQVNLRMAPFGELVNIQVTKYLVSAPLPTY
jgi:hypothetical protein